MSDVFQTMLLAIESGRPAVYCRLIETRGSTPQKAGALMIVFEDGSQAGTLGGGCVEAEVKRKALAQLHDNATEVATFHLDSDYGWDDGLICGGRMKVLIAPIAASSASNQAERLSYFSDLAKGVLAGEGLTEVISLDQPQAFLFSANGELRASLTAQEPTPELTAALKPLTARPRPHIAAGAAYLPLLPRCRLLIVGGGHVGQAVASLAAQVEFDVWVVDDRADVLSPERFPSVQRRIVGEIESVLPQVEVTPDTYCLIVTRGHNHDEAALYHLAERGARYVGMIGSRRKIKLIFDDLLEKGVSRQALSQVYAPLGIDIGSQTVPEIAVSVCAELIAHRNLGVVPGRSAGVEF